MAFRRQLGTLIGHLGNVPGMCCHGAASVDDKHEVVVPHGGAAVAVASGEFAVEGAEESSLCDGCSSSDECTSVETFAGGAAAAGRGPALAAEAPAKSADGCTLCDGCRSDDCASVESSADAPLEDSAIAIAVAPEELAAAGAADAADAPLGPPPRPDFSGTWVLSRIEGEMDPFLRESGFGFVTRSAMAAAGFGVGKLQNTIVQAGDAMEVTARCIGRTHTVKFMLDGVEREGKDPMDGSPVKFSAAWEKDGRVIRVTGRWAHSGKAVPTNRRYMEGDEMHIQQIAPTGRLVTRVFTRR